MDITRLIAALTLALCATVSRAAILDKTYEYHGDGNIGTGSIDIEPFDVSLGVLTSVYVNVGAEARVPYSSYANCVPNASGVCEIAGSIQW